MTTQDNKKLDEMADEAASLSELCWLALSRSSQDVRMTAILDLYGRMLAGVKPAAREMVALWHTRNALKIADAIDKVEGRHVNTKDKH
jgi:hypothetical protein